MSDNDGKYTPEPWRLHIVPGQKQMQTITGAHHYDKDYIAVLGADFAPWDNEGYGEPAEGVVCDNAGYYAFPVTLENARRIVACVNALAGVPTEEIEKVFIHAQSIKDVVQQRDELIAALEQVIAISDRKHDAWDRAKAAIAACKTT